MHRDRPSSRLPLVLAASAVGLLAVWRSAPAAPPPPPPPAALGLQQLTLQARIAQAGQPLSGSLALTFAIHDSATGGTPIWQESHDGGLLPKVPVANGILSVVLGRGTPLGPLVLDPQAAAERWVSISLAGVEVGRVRLTAAAYAVAASAANGLWDGSSRTALDLAALDQRYLSAQGGGAVRSVNGVAPDAQGRFGIAAAPSGNIVVTATANGILLDTSGSPGGIRTINGVSPDAQGAFTLAAGSGVSIVPGPQGVVLSSTGADLPALDARFVNAGGDSVSGSLSVAGTVSAGGNLEAVGHCNVGGFINAQGGIQLGGDLQWNGASGRISGTSGAALSTFRLDATNLSLVAADTLASGRLRVGGNLEVAGIKSFVVPHPSDPTREIVYSATESPEALVTVRGTATLSNGTATIALPAHFALVADPLDVTATATPLGECKGLYVASRSTSQLVVRELSAGASSVSFDWVVYAPRAGTRGNPVVRPRTN